MKNVSLLEYQLLLVFFILCTTNVALATSQNINQGLMIVAYDGNAWYPYIKSTKNKNSRWKKIKAIENPGDVSWQPETGDFFIKSDDQKLYQFNIVKQSLLPLISVTDSSAKDNSYTQLRAYAQGVVMTKLIEGKSQNTQIVAIEKNAKIKTLLKQASAQFHPYRYMNYLYYAHVSCRIECTPLIQEIWRKNLISGKTEQLSLLNAVSYLHSIDSNGRYGFLSSNHDGFYHIARIDLNSGEISWLTKGQVTDNFPSITYDGNLYFLRRTQAGSKLMMLDKNDMNSDSKIADNAYQAIALPKDVQKVRYLEFLD